MAIGTALGILTGLFFGEYCSIFSPWASAYIMILKVTTIPYLFCAIIHGIGQLYTSQALQILKNGLLFIALAWVINLGMIYCGVFLFSYNPGPSMANYVASPPSSINFAEILIPDNIFYALGNNIVPAIVVFSLVLGISLMHIRDKMPLMHLLTVLVDSLTKITSWISRITPIGTFIIIANQVGTIQLSTIKQVSTYIIVYILMICILVFWIFPRIISSLTNINASRWVKDLFPILLLGYTTNVIIVCLPFIIELIKKEIQQFLPTQDRVQSQIQGTVSIVFNLPLGSLFISLFVFFIAIFYGNPLHLTAQVQLFISAFLTSLGSVGLGAWINSLNFILDTLGLPLEAVNIYLTTLPFVSGFQSMVSVMEIASLSLLITLACHKLLTPKIGRVLRKSLFTVIPVFALIIAIKTYNPLPKIQNCTPSIYEVQLLPSLSVGSPGCKIENDQDPLSRILLTKTLRVGYSANVVPFCFINHYGHLSGFDLAFAEQLAFDLGCQLVLVPMDYGRIVQQLSNNEFDIAMSAVSITEDRLPQLYFSKPYLEAAIVFVGKEKERKRLSSLDYIASNQIKIAALKGSSYEKEAQQVFPNNSIIPLDNYDDFANSDADLLFWSENQAISWVVLHPGYTIIHPCPEIGADTLAYAMPQGANLLLNYVNLWLDLKKQQGFTEQQYDLWILGKTETVTPAEPHWSILKDVFGW